MLKSVIIRPAAAEEIDEAYRWYEAQRLGWGEIFLSEVHRVLARIQKQPERYSVLRRNTRRAMLARFPYALFYRLVDKEDAILREGVAEHEGNHDSRGVGLRFSAQLLLS